MNRFSSSRSVRLSDRDLATVLAAPRHWQRCVPEPKARESSPLHFESAERLTHAEVDALCERLNFSDGSLGDRT